MILHRIVCYVKDAISKLLLWFYVQLGIFYLALGLPMQLHFTFYPIHLAICCKVTLFFFFYALMVEIKNLIMSAFYSIVTEVLRMYCGFEYVAWTNLFSVSAEPLAHGLCERSGLSHSTHSQVPFEIILCFRINLL